MMIEGMLPRSQHNSLDILYKNIPPKVINGVNIATKFDVQRNLFFKCS